MKTSGASSLDQDLAASPLDARKVFCIGLNKTGTKSLAKCAKLLGLRATGCDKRLLGKWVLHGDLSASISVAEAHDFFHDWPWPMVYKNMDRLFPGGAFILTVRSDPERWLRSLTRHSMRTHPKRHCRKLAYGFDYPHGQEQHHLGIYEKHNDDARAFFRDRRQDFLEVCWEKGDGWKEICAFLGKDIPELPFPHVNRADQQSVRWSRWISNRLRRMLSRRRAVLPTSVTAGRPPGLVR